MTVKELNREQLVQLKCAYLTREHDVSYGELAAADKIVSDEIMFEEDKNFDFSEGDFE